MNLKTKAPEVSTRAPQPDFKVQRQAVRPGIVAFWSPPGSVGRTTTALNVAACAAIRVRVLLVDLDFVSPSVAVLAANQDLPSLSTVLHHHQITSSFDETFLREFAPHFSGSSEGFRVVAGLSRPERWPEIKPQFLQQFFQSLSPFIDLIVCDLQASSHKLLTVNAVARGILAEAHSVIALANANPLGLSRLLREIHELRAIRRSAESIHVVFNRLSTKSPQPIESAAFVELTKMPTPMTIRDDRDAFELLVASASTKATMRKRSAYKTDIQALTDTVLGL